MQRRICLKHKGWQLALARFSSAVILAAFCSPAMATDLSQYRDFTFGATLSDVAQQIDKPITQATTIQVRPALLQELEWRPQSLSSSFPTEPVREVMFSFCDDELYRILVNYDRYRTTGMNDADLVESISEIYGPVSEPTLPPKVASRFYESMDVMLAEWHDLEHRYELIRLPYGPSYRLVGYLKRLEAPVALSIGEAKRLDDLEAPQRKLDRIALEREAADASDSAARAENKEKFRP